MNQRIPRFQEMKPRQTRVAGRLDYLAKGKLKLTGYGIYFGELTFEELGLPEHISLGADTKNYMIKLAAVASRKDGWKPRLLVSTVSGYKHYLVRIAKHGSVNKLPKGIYVPVGGGVYAYKEEHQTN